MADDDNSTKRCKVCGTDKRRSEFSRDDRKFDGLRYECRQCRAAQAVAYRKANPDKVKASKTAHYAAHKDQIATRSAAYCKANPDKVKAWYAAWYAANRTRALAYASAYFAAHKVEGTAQREVWRKANPERKAVYSHTRRARKRAAGGVFIAADVADIRRMQKDRCAACGKPLRKKGHVDHIVPLAKGGSNDRRNLQLLCQPCNIRKHMRDPIEFMQARGFLL